MTTSSEDVLLQIPEVRYKKGDGTVFLMDQRLIWMIENRDTVAVSHVYADIKSQKISPEGKSKVQLQVVLHNGISSTFHFINKNGLQSQLADRDKVKDLLQSLLPKFKKQVDRELEEKNKFLSTNPSLLQLYKDLVMAEIVTSEEFWAEHASQYTEKQNKHMQNIGVSGAFLADIKPQTDGCNGLKYNITPDIIECIFKTYPAVKKKYIEYIPAGKLSESQFWTKFFQSHYFHRDRKYSEAKDLFTDCGRIDDAELRRDIQKGVADPTVNLIGMEDTEKLDDDLLKNIGGGDCALPHTTSSSISVSRAMIKRFNQHSIMVLNATTPKDGCAAVDRGKNGIINCRKQRADGISGGRNLKKRKIQEKIIYKDLDEFDDFEDVIPTLNLTKVERYFHGPMPDSFVDPVNQHETQSVARTIAYEIEQWTQFSPPYRQANVNAYGNSSNNSNGTSIVSAAAAVSALGELSPGGALMRGFQEQSLAQLVPQDIENEVRSLYLALCELLRHFWRCLPPNSVHSEEKLVKMNEALHRFQSAKLKPFEDRLICELSPLSHHLTKHLNQLLNTAYQRFNAWQSKQIR